MFGMGKLYFWVLASDGSGNPVLNGPFDSESQARSDSGDLENVKIYKLRTRDRDSATRKIKSMRLKQTGKSAVALQKVHHQEPSANATRRSFFEPDGEDIRSA